MRRKFFLTLLLLSIAVTAASAKRPRVSLEWGVIAGLNIPNYSTNQSGFSLKDKLGWQAGITTAVNFGSFAIEPQILYVRQGLRIRPDNQQELNLKTNSVDVPIFFSLRMLRPVRFYLGPVFTVMNDCKQKEGGNLLDFGRLRPTISGAIGVGVMVTPHMLIDLRYNGQLRSKHHVVLPSGDTIDKLRMHHIAFNFAYIF